MTGFMSLKTRSEKMPNANKLKSVNIKGKQYVEVNERIKYFRENYEGWSLTTELVSLENGICVMKATVRDTDNVVKATGFAYEKEGSSFINETSYIENCETSAWGRALGNLGIGIDASIASAEEVQNAQLNQHDKKDFDLKEADARIAKAKTEDEVRKIYAEAPQGLRKYLEKGCKSRIAELKS